MLGFLGVKAVCVILERGPGSVKPKASRMGVSLRKKTQMDATVLQPAVLERLRQRAPGLVCPSCGMRLASDKLGGVCGPCHKQVLIDVHLEKLAEIESQRELWKARQQLRRGRKRLAAETGGDAASV